MNREQLAHVLRAAAKIAGDGEILVLGSQAILGSFDADALPEAASMSVEADVAFFTDPGAVKSDLVDGAIGELSSFHTSFGYYGQGVEISTAVLPVGWEARAQLLPRTDMAPAAARCLEPHDLVISKLVAGRQKDLDFTTALIQAGLIDPDLLRRRADNLEQPHAVVHRVLQRIDRCVRDATDRNG